MAILGNQRRLATILAGDVVGYSKLMSQDEEATVRTLKAHREIIDKLIARHDGRIFNTAGDSVIAEFGSAVEAVRCAITIQDELRVRNAELVADRQMLFRIGVNVGDVIVDGDNLLGDGVNVAARLESIAPPGGIFISGSTFEHVKNKLSVGFEDMGPQEVKNIPEPVAAFKITSAPVSVRSETSAAAPRAETIAFGQNRRKLALTVAALVILLAAGAGAFWGFYPPDPAPLASFPANFSTDTMLSKDIEALVAGMTIQGISKRTGRPWTIKLMAGGTANVEFERPAAASGTKSRDSGKWWATDYRFCMQFSMFAKGRQMCPTFIRKGQTLSVSRPDGTLLQWTLKK